MTIPSPHNDHESIVEHDNALPRVHDDQEQDVTALVGRSRLSQALELEEIPDNRYLRLILYGLAAVVGLFFPWAAMTPVTQVINASGEIVPDGNINIIQHLEGGIVSKVSVQDGERVHAGEVMIELRPALVEAEYNSMRQQLLNLQQQKKQLQAVISGDANAQFENNSVSAAQKELYQSRLINKSDQIAVADAQIRQKQEELAMLDNQIRTFQREQMLYRQQRSMYTDLVRSGAASRLSLLNVDQQLAASETKLTELRGTRARALQLLREAQANLRNLKSGLRLEQNSQIAALVNEEAVISENIKKLKNQLDRTSIKAPIDGVVSDLRYRSPGTVISPGAVVLSIVPDNTQKLVEVRIPSDDIGYVEKGQKVKVKLIPYDSSIYGSIPGKIISISPSTTQDQDNRRYYYNARISLDQQFIKSSIKRYPLQVSMPVVAEIQGPQRNVLQYLFKPFSRTIGAAMRE